MNEPAKKIPPEQWTVAPVSDSSDYLGGEPPTYADDEADKPRRNRQPVASLSSAWLAVGS
jgi:hypothetical protein